MIQLIINNTEKRIQFDFLYAILGESSPSDHLLRARRVERGYSPLKSNERSEAAQ
jgi:hypothetical protein